MPFFFRALILLLCSQVISSAEILLPAFFSDGMVLQRETQAAIWGKGAQHATVKAEFAGQTVSSTSDENGDWKVSFTALKASAQERDLKITVGSEQKVIQNVLVGEVWIASGQSNMEWPMSKTDSAEYAQSVNRPIVRQYVCRNVASRSPQWDLPGHWSSATNSSTAKFSAVGFHFAEEISETLGVPVGIIELAWGGRPVESFMRAEVIENLPEATPLLKKNVKKAERKTANANHYGTIFNGLIAPMVGYGARGVIWYQGESNSNDWRAGVYAKHLQAMVADWRALWGNELSFYQVQIANYHKSKNKRRGENRWVELQDQQRRSLAMIPKSGIVITNDIGDPLDVHPGNKKDVGLRLALWAKHHDYGKSEVLYSGPLYKSVEFTGGAAVVSFSYDQGLKASDEAPLRWFELADEDGNWVTATASVNGGKIEVTAEGMSAPTKVRYAWHENPEGANLTNASGLPASCFTSEEK